MIFPGEAFQHLLSPRPAPIPTPWRDAAPTLLYQSYPERWDANLAVTEDGSVSAAQIRHGPMEQRDEVIAALSSLRFRPFVRDGHPAAVTINYFSIEGRPADYRGTADRAFPAQIDYSQVRVRLTRTGCFGTCPAYQLEIRGDGEVIYSAEGNTLIDGEHRWRIPRERVVEIINLMRDADYFRLAGHYMADASDLPTYITGLDIGDQHKFVLNYGGGPGMGGAVASVVMGPGTGPSMPPTVTQIEETIDRLSGATSWVTGDENTITALRAANWAFRSPQGGLALGHAISNCELPLARALLAEGVPVSGDFSNGWSEGSVISFAPRCGDRRFVNELIAAGALRTRAAANSFLWESARAGDPELVRVALRHSRAVNARREEGETLLMAAADAWSPDDNDPRTAYFDRNGVVRLLLAAGANAYARNDDGENALFSANYGGTIRLLLAAGANPRARDGYWRRTPLFSTFDPDAARAFIEAGVDINATDRDGKTALFGLHSTEVALILIQAGADVDHADAQGRTALDDASDDDVALVLVETGARLPVTRESTERLLVRARRGAWRELLPRLEAHARALGVQVEAQP